MNNEKIDPNRVPQLRGEFLYIPFVGAIIERSSKDGKEVLVQVRHKETDSKYKDVIEIPGGKFRAFEDIFENRGDTSGIINPFCVTQMREGPFIGLIFLCKGEGELAVQTDETKEIRWMGADELRGIVTKEPERIYTAFLAPLKKYFSN